jgi:DsbC/DsbD-like thiol-disulfide interchange protein
MMRLIGLLLAGLLLPSVVLAQPHPQTRKPLVTPKLVADVAGIKPGAQFTLGILLDIEPGWHVYWKNPGDAGLPTKVSLKLPEGFSAGELLFPIPRQFVQPGDITGIGYENQVMLMIPVTAPAELESGGVTIEANVSWLVCAEICIPGKASLSINLPTSASAEPANEELFAQWRPQLPEDPGAGEHPIDAKFEGSLSSDHTWRPFRITLSADRPLARPQFITSNADAVLVRNIEVESRGQEAVVTFEARLLPGQKLGIDELPALLTYELPGGQRGGVNVDVPLTVEDVPNPTEGG